jgi:replication factor A1
MTVAEQSYLPIGELSAYQTKWVIKARVTNKAPMRTWSKNGNEGKVFHVELLDAEGGEIRASFFNQA